MIFQTNEGFGLFRRLSGHNIKHVSKKLLHVLISVKQFQGINLPKQDIDTSYLKHADGSSTILFWEPLFEGVRG